jgi:hypothetical protein
MIKLNQIEPFEIGFFKRISITVNPPLAQENTNTLIIETQCNITSNDNIKYVDVYENGVLFLAGVSCTGMSWNIGGGKLSITITDTESPISSNDKISIFVGTTQEDAAFTN